MPDVVMEVRCLVCPGLIERVPRDQARAVAVEHFHQHHPGEAIEGGEHYAIRAMALVCDGCMTVVELPWWEHVSTPPTPAAGRPDGDGLWLLCDPCHELCQSGDLIGWVRRTWGVAIEQAPWLLQQTPAMRAKSRRYLADTLRVVLEHLDSGHRVTTAN